MCNFVFTYSNGTQMSGPMGVTNLCTPELKESPECSPNRPARTITIAITGKVVQGDDLRGELGGKPFILVFTFNDKKGTFRTPPCDVSCESSIAAQIVSEISDAVADAALLSEFGFWSTVKKKVSIEATEVATYAFARSRLKALASKSLPDTLGVTTVRSRLVLGNYPAYVTISKELQALRFGVRVELWEVFSEADRWAANQRMLDFAIKLKWDIVLATPIRTISEATGKSYPKELEYLVKKGYRLSADGNRMIK